MIDLLIEKIIELIDIRTNQLNQKIDELSNRLDKLERGKNNDN